MAYVVCQNHVSNWSTKNLENIIPSLKMQEGESVKLKTGEGTIAHHWRAPQ